MDQAHHLRVAPASMQPPTGLHLRSICLLLKVRTTHRRTSSSVTNREHSLCPWQPASCSASLDGWHMFGAR
jgi:hypothetical protein